jgi:hypothetical protein
MLLKLFSHFRALTHLFLLLFLFLLYLSQLFWVLFRGWDVFCCSIQWCQPFLFQPYQLLVCQEVLLSNTQLSISRFCIDIWLPKHWGRLSTLVFVGFPRKPGEVVHTDSRFHTQTLFNFWLFGCHTFFMTKWPILNIVVLKIWFWVWWFESHRIFFSWGELILLIDISKSRLRSISLSLLVQILNLP